MTKLPADDHRPAASQEEHILNALVAASIAAPHALLEIIDQANHELAAAAAAPTSLATRTSASDDDNRYRHQ